MSDVFERAEAWMKSDVDEAARGELRGVIERAKSGDAKANADLAERFTGPLEFGTAGLRGLLGAGESRMNRAVVVRTTQGLGEYLSKTEPSVTKRGVVIGYDGRHLSREMAEDSARGLAALGIPSFLSPRPCPTPLTAFAVSHLGAAAGVMVTASHNPPAYNGYKVYWGNGAQIIPPHDTGIARSIEKVSGASSVKRPSMDEAKASGLAKELDDSIERKYLDAVRGLSVRKDGDRSIAIVYTAMHGVGTRLTTRALAEAGFGNVHLVKEQAEPDGDFPTVAFPNPEEKGALDLSFALAEKTSADLIVANDPDVDRLALAVRDASKKWTQLTGNQVGVLLGHYVITGAPAALTRTSESEAPKTPRTDKKRLALASIVSSPMLGRICSALGVEYEETLTGFKWIANRAMELEKSAGVDFVFGYEEALGYTVGPVVRDKDGISAAVIACELAAVLKSQKKTLLDELEALARRYGLFVSGQRSITMPGSDGLAKIGEVMKRLRATSLDTIGAHAVEAIADYQARTRTPIGGEPAPLALPASNVLAWDLRGGSRIIARPSGTEPKIKFYFDLREEMKDGERAADAEARAMKKLDELAKAFVAVAGV